MLEWLTSLGAHEDLFYLIKMLDSEERIKQSQTFRQFQTLKHSQKRMSNPARADSSDRSDTFQCLTRHVPNVSTVCTVIV